MLITCARLHPAGRAGAGCRRKRENPLVPRALHIHTPPPPSDHSLALSVCSVSHARDALGLVHEESLLAQEFLPGPEGLADRASGTLGQEVSQLELPQVRLGCGPRWGGREGLPAPVGAQQRHSEGEETPWLRCHPAGCKPEDDGKVQKLKRG